MGKKVAFEVSNNKLIIPEQWDNMKNEYIYAHFPA